MHGICACKRDGLHAIFWLSERAQHGSPQVQRRGANLAPRSVRLASHAASCRPPADSPNRRPSPMTDAFISRRRLLQSSAAGAALGVLGAPFTARPARAAGATVGFIYV